MLQRFRVRRWLGGLIIVGVLLLGLNIMNLVMAADSNSVVHLNLAQGIQGQVVHLEGNRMPGIGRNASEPQPVSTAVWVFAGKIQSEGPRWPVSEAQQHEGWVASVLSNSEGQFQVGLPPGEYTVFAQEGADLYLNSFTGDNKYKTVEVAEGQLVTMNLVNTEKGVF